MFESRVVKEVIEEMGAVLETGEEFPCKMCGKISTSKNRLRNHIQSCHDIPEDCKECGKTFSSRKYARRHYREVHTDCSFKCPKCSEGFKSRRILKVHKQTCGRWRVKKKLQLMVQCTMCTNIFPSNPCLRKHAWKHHQVLLHNPAPSIRSRRRVLFASRRPRNLAAHSRRHLLGVQEQQQQEEQELGVQEQQEEQELGVQEHQEEQQEEIEELLVCGFQGCGFISRSKKGIHKHKRDVHKGERAFFCNLCDHTFAKSKDMLQHRARVHKGLPFKCRGEDGVTGCGKFFRRKDNLKAHLRACGAPLHKPWLLLGPSQKAKRIKRKASQFRAELDSMEKDERKANIRALVKNNPDFLDSQTTNPFTTEDVIEVRQLLFV